MANKRVIDLSTLSETVQEGQYILVDSSGGTGKMDLKKIVDDSTETLTDQVEQNTQDIENLSGDLETLEGMVDDAEEAITGKADDDGIYPELYAGNLISDKMQEDKTPYLFRKTGGTLSDIGERCYDTIVGASVGENQLVQNGDFASADGWVSYSGTVAVSGGKLTFTAAEQNNYAYVGRSDLANSVANHVYLSSAYITMSEASTNVALSRGGVYSDKYFSVSANTRTKCEKVFKATSEGTAFYIYPMREGNGIAVGSTMVIEKVQNIDLTALLGSTIADYIYSLETATAGSGIAKLRSWGFLKGYQAYNAGSLESVEVTGKKVRGFNQWDEIWENGRIKTTTGKNDTGAGIRTKNYVPVLPSTTYYVKALANTFIIEYDADKNYVRYASYYKDAEYTTSANAYYIRFYQVNITAYGNDICINLSSDRNGEYEPYTEQTYDYGNDTLNGIFKLDASNNLYADGDVKTADGVITRKYKKSAIASVKSVGTSSAGVKYAAIGVLANVKRDGYIMSATHQNANNASTDMSIRLIVDMVFVYDNRFTDLATAQNILVGMEILYELATPTTEQGDPFPSPQVCYPDGTEEYVTSNGVPVGHETEYPYDLKGLVEGLIDVPDVPSANGTYLLKATRSASGVAYSWVTG